MAVDVEMQEFLKDITGVVEATRCEEHYLWKEYNNDLGWDWKQGGMGLVHTVGMTDKMPTCISLFVNEVRGEKILFWHATSQLVDYRLVDKWMKKNIPKSAYRKDNFINKTDATNFCNLFPNRNAA